MNIASEKQNNEYKTDEQIKRMNEILQDMKQRGLISDKPNYPKRDNRPIIYPNVVSINNRLYNCKH